MLRTSPIPSMVGENNHKTIHLNTASISETVDALDVHDNDERIDVAGDNLSVDEEERVEDGDENEDDGEDAYEMLLPSDMMLSDFNQTWSEINQTSYRYEDVDYTLMAMRPPSINGDEECSIVPGEPFVQVEKAPQNSRRLFATVDIPTSVDVVWNLLTDYENLQNYVPNLFENEVLELFPGNKAISTPGNETLPDIDKCKTMANQMKGSVLKQVGGAKVMGITFRARTTLEVREWPMGMPDFAHFEHEGENGGNENGRELERHVFPRPLTLPSLPHMDISMQSIEKDDGEFRMYQGVWRMQSLPGCSSSEESAMRLAYAAEVSPRPYLPVALVEGRVAQDLAVNLMAIRDLFLK